MQHYKALVVERQGDTVVATMKSLPRPQPRDGEVLIEVRYSSINYKDALAVSGPSAVVRKLPLVAGVDAAGVVIESRSDMFQTGDEVIVTGYELSQTHDGGYADLLCVPGEWTVPLPDSLDLQQAMALGTAGFTAALAVHRLRQNDQSPPMGPILVSGATGGVGSFAINILSQLGFEVVALTGKPQISEPYLRRLGAARIVDRHAQAFNRRPLETAQWGGAVDTLGGDVLAWLASSVVPYGNIAACGLAADAALHTSVMPFILRGVSVLGIASSLCDMQLRRRLWSHLSAQWRPSQLPAVVSGVVGLHDVRTIAAHMLAGHTTGRYVVDMRKS